MLSAGLFFQFRDFRKELKQFADQRGRTAIGDPDGRVFADPPVAAIEEDAFVLRRAAEQPVVAAFRNAFDQHFERAAHVAAVALQRQFVLQIDDFG